MARLYALAAIIGVLAAGPALAGLVGEGANRDSLLRKGMEQHDAGSFKAAIESFQQALRLNPRDATALYEIAHSYVSLGDFKNCLTFARRSVDIQPAAMAYNLLARCQDELGDGPGVLATFTEGLARYPGDVQLNLNYAVTLARQRKNAEAKEHLRVAVNADPSYATPYLTYAGVLAGEQNAVGALYMWVRFLMLEPGTQRSRSVALYLKELLIPTTDAKTGKRMTIRLATGNDPRNDFPTNPKIPAFTLKVSGKSDERKPADQFVSNAQLMFSVIADSIEKDTPRDRQTFVWQSAGVPIADLERAKLRETFLYYVAGLAGLEGASTWLDTHTSEFEALKAELAKR
jgi:tetratricopeptide (TPR) repeat protein